MRWLALDLGEKNIGVAVSDPDGVIAQPLTTLRRTGEAEDAERVAALVRQLGAAGVVVGLPRRLDGTDGPEAEAARRFGEALSRAGVPRVTLWDERLTTVEAERVLLASDLSRRRRRQVIDRMAAVVILQSYLEAARRQRGRHGEFDS